MDIAKLGGKKELVEGGVWVNLDEKTSIKVCARDNPAFSKVLKRICTPHRQSIRHETIKPEKMVELTCEAMAEAILVDWKGMLNNGAEVKYTREKAKEFLIASPKFREIVDGCASDASLFAGDEEGLDATKKSLSGT